MLFGILTPIGLACCGSPVMNPTIANWFQDKRALALALAQLGGGLSYVYVVLVEYTIEIFDWRVAYIIMGITVIAVLLPLILAFYQFHPTNNGPFRQPSPRPPPKGVRAGRRDSGLFDTLPWSETCH